MQQFLFPPNRHFNERKRFADRELLARHLSDFQNTLELIYLTKEIPDMAQLPDCERRDQEIEVTAGMVDAAFDVWWSSGWVESKAHEAGKRLVRDMLMSAMKARQAAKQS